MAITQSSTHKASSAPRGAKTERKASRAAAKPADAIKLLKDDHREVKDMFRKFEAAKDDDSKLKLAKQICIALTVHAQIEEELFYPAARAAIDDDDLLDEAEVEHGSAKQLIADIESMQPGDPLFDAKVSVLGEYINHHVEEEEGEMFPEVKDSKVDLKALGQQLAERKQALMQQMGAL